MVHPHRSGSHIRQRFGVRVFYFQGHCKHFLPSTLQQTLESLSAMAFAWIIKLVSAIKLSAFLK